MAARRNLQRRVYLLSTISRYLPLLVASKVNRAAKILPTEYKKHFRLSLTAYRSCFRIGCIPLLVAGK
jgi:hypothetical protein